MNDIPDYMRGFDLDEDYGFTPVDAKPKSDTTFDKKVHLFLDYGFHPFPDDMLHVMRGNLSALSKPGRQ